MAVNTSCLHRALHQEIDGMDCLQCMLVGMKASRCSSGVEKVGSLSYWQNGPTEAQAESNEGQEDVDGVQGS